jgi:hypothetical protein
MERDTRLLLVFLRQNLILRHAYGSLKPALNVCGSTYREQTKFGRSTGHYDWLRSMEGRVQGVRHWPFDDTELAPIIQQLLNSCRALSYAKIEDGKYFEITFTSPVNINHDTSQDQDLSYNGIYRSDAGEFLLYFDTSALTPDEWNELSRTATEYVEEKA